MTTGSAADPAILLQPQSGAAAYGESFGFSVTAGGTPPLSYQWQFGSSPLAGATNAALTINNITNTSAGNYSVVISNIVGSATSTPALLTTSPNAPRSVKNGAVRSDGRAVVPLYLAGNGRETSVGFSLAFSTNAFINPSFEPLGDANLWSLDNTRANDGLVGLSISRPAPATFLATNQLLGVLRFDFVSTSDPLAGRLAFTNAPTPLQAIDTNLLVMSLGSALVPQLQAVTVSPRLNRQSGLFEHWVDTGYAGAESLANVNLLVAGLGVDSRTNAIRVQNAVGSKLIGPDAEGFYENVPFVTAGPFAPGESRRLTVEYLVSDHTTVPNPGYSLLIDGRAPLVIPASATPLGIRTNRFVNNTFIIQFPTRTKHNYFVQYAPTPDDLANNSTNARLASPTIIGTGYDVQWIDNGPPKTEAPPTQGSRFYRMLEVPSE